MQKWRKKSPSAHHCTTLSAISSQLRHVSTIGEKNLLNSNMSSTCSHNMANFSLLMAEMGSGVWGTPANFNGFCVLAALLHGTRAVGVSKSLRCRTRNGITEHWQKAPPIFGRAAITLSIGAHSSFFILYFICAPTLLY